MPVKKKRTVRLKTATVGAGPVPARLPDRANIRVDGVCAFYEASGWHGACPYIAQPHGTKKAAAFLAGSHKMCTFAADISEQRKQSLEQAGGE